MSEIKRATCPSCGRVGRFAAAGEQRWPAAVVAAHGLPPVMTLWTCPHCQTTVSEMALLESPRFWPLSETVVGRQVRAFFSR